MLGQRRRRWAHIKPALLHQRLVFAGTESYQTSVYATDKMK